MQYWPRSAWEEAHNSFGETAPGTRWGLAEGRSGGSNAAQTFILLANPGTETAQVTITFLRTAGVPIVKTFSVSPTSRFTVRIGGASSDVPELSDEAFGAIAKLAAAVGSVAPPFPIPSVVGRAFSFLLVLGP